MEVYCETIGKGIKYFLPSPLSKFVNGCKYLSTYLVTAVEANTSSSKSESTKFIVGVGEEETCIFSILNGFFSAIS